MNVHGLYSITDIAQNKFVFKFEKEEVKVEEAVKQSDAQMDKVILANREMIRVRKLSIPFAKYVVNIEGQNFEFTVKKDEKDKFYYVIAQQNKETEYAYVNAFGRVKNYLFVVTTDSKVYKFKIVREIVSNTEKKEVIGNLDSLRKKFEEAKEVQDLDQLE
jgi:hypothetical protein